MTSAALSSERICELYEAYCAEDPYSPWRKDYLESLERFLAIEDQALATPAIQQELWSLRRVATLGSGDAVNVQGAWTDEAVVRRIVELRLAAKEPDDHARARRLQAHFNDIISLVVTNHSDRRPFARLSRLFAVLVPRQCHAAFSTESRAAIARTLRGATGDGGIYGHVLDRARLRECLGSESDTAEDAWRATFCWWLYEHADTLARGDAPAAATTAGPIGPPVAVIEQAPAQRPPLQLLPGPRLRRGFVAFKGYAVTVRLIVESVQGGATPDDVVQVLRSTDGYETVGPSHARAVFNLVRNNLGMLEHRDGLWYPSKLGERLLDDPRYDPLVEKMLTEIFGLAHYLRLVAEQPLTRKASNLRLRQIYPAWTTDRAPTSIAYWAHSLGLVHILPDRRAELTEYGEEWASRLPAELPVPPLRSDVDDSEPFQDDEDDEPTDTDAAPDAPRSTPRLAELSADIAALRPDFVQDSGILEALHLAWHGLPGKRFVIFSGLSGTGKTLLFKLYAMSYCRHLGLEVDQHLTIVPVSPDWRDPTGLIGYFNALHADPTYQPEPALRLILQAHRHPNRPYFLILDEMNLARIEHYFAPFLSAMETGDALNLHAHETAINRVPPAIPWPTNLFIGGTVNMDETTQPISDKVLDRAFTVEFWDVDLPGYFATRAAAGRPSHATAEQLLLDLHAILREVRRHFGYRTAGEVLAMLDAAAAEGITATPRVLDQAVFSKLLPRIRGHESKALSDALRLARERCEQASLARCARKLGEMEATLRNSGLTRFWA